MPIAQPTPYLNTISNIEDVSSLIKFYDLIFNNTLILVIVIFIIIYCRMVIYKNMNQLKVIKLEKSSKTQGIIKKNLFDTFKITQKKIIFYDRRRK